MRLKFSTVNPSNNIFCDKCVYNLDEPEATPTIDYTQAQSYTPKFIVGKIVGTRVSIEWESKLLTLMVISMTTPSKLGNAWWRLRDYAFVSEPQGRKVLL